MALAVELFRDAKGLEAVDAERWLELVEGAQPAALDVIVELMRRHVNAAAASRSLRWFGWRAMAASRRGWDWRG